VAEGVKSPKVTLLLDHRSDWVLLEIDKSEMGGWLGYLRISLVRAGWVWVVTDDR